MSVTYDWKKTLAPEKPYNYEYHKTMMTEMKLTEKTDAGLVVLMDFKEALEKIEALDKITLHCPKIVFLSGLFGSGEKSGYPAIFDIVSELKLPEHSSAQESFNWFFMKASEFNTKISVKIDMVSGYDDSSLIDTYYEKNLLIKDKHGNLIKIGGAYKINLLKEDEQQLLLRRINKFIDNFYLKKTGVVLIENFGYFKNDEISLDEFSKVRSKVIKYFKKSGVDVVLDYLYYEAKNGGEKNDCNVGQIPAVMNLSQSLIDYMERPANLLCAVTVTHRFKECESSQMGKLFAMSSNLKDIFSLPDYKEKIFEEFCTKTLKYFLLNSLDRISASVTSKDTVVNFTKNTATFLAEDRLTINGVTAKIGNEFVLPTFWYDHDTAVVYTEKGGRCDWNLSKILGFSSSQNIVLCELTSEGLSTKKKFLSLKDGMLELDLNPGEKRAYLISRM